MTAPMRSFRVPDDEWQQWQAAAEARGLDRSEWVRRVVQAAAEREVPGTAQEALVSALCALEGARREQSNLWGAAFDVLRRAQDMMRAGRMSMARALLERGAEDERALTGSTTHTDAVLAALDGAG